jgi:formylglycine-generating enzyme required for sulfatase activity
MVMVPASAFFMGSDERDVENDERPAHKVRLDAYCIDRTEVTVAAYAECVTSGACSGGWNSNEWADISKSDRATFDSLCNGRVPASRGQHPANCVSWMQAHDFCGAEGARLPTEAEWELAARGTDGRRYPWGDAEPTESVAPTGPVTGEERVLRGGAWNGADSAWVRPTYRFNASPEMKSHGIGFRCARTLVGSGDGGEGGGVR